MQQSKRFPYLVLVAAAAVLLVAAGLPPGLLIGFLFLLACPLMMVVMMRNMGGMDNKGEDHTGHGCEHDPTRTPTSDHR
jgi:hypothetical protein